MINFSLYRHIHPVGSISLENPIMKVVASGPRVRRMKLADTLTGRLAGSESTGTLC